MLGVGEKQKFSFFRIIVINTIKGEEFSSPFFIAFRRSRHFVESIIKKIVPIGASDKNCPLCNAPLQSSHLWVLFVPILLRTSIAQSLMGTLFVIPPQPSSNALSRVLKTRKVGLPNTFFLETAKEPFNKATLLRRIRRDKFLLESVISTSSSEPSTLKDQPIVTAKHGSGSSRT